MSHLGHRKFLRDFLPPLIKSKWVTKVYIYDDIYQFENLSKNCTPTAYEILPCTGSRPFWIIESGCWGREIWFGPSNIWSPTGLCSGPHPVLGLHQRPSPRHRPTGAYVCWWHCHSSNIWNRAWQRHFTERLGPTPGMGIKVGYGV